jgi:hypothetical protein
MFVWPSVRPHILCTQLVISLFSHFIHIWYLGWPRSEHAHIIPISRMVDFCESHSPFHVYLTNPTKDKWLVTYTRLRDERANKSIPVYPPLCEWGYNDFNLKFSNHPWFSSSPFHVYLTIRPFAHLVYATSHLSFVAFYSYLVSWLAMIGACAYCTDFTDGWFCVGIKRCVSSQGSWLVNVWNDGKWCITDY